MSENNFKIKATVREQGLTQSGETAFNQRKFISDIYECEKQKYILDKRYNKLEKESRGPQHPNFEKTQYFKQYCKEAKKKEKMPPFVENQEISFSDFLGDMEMSGIIGVVIGSIVNIIIDIIKGDWVFAPVIIITIFCAVFLPVFHIISDNNDYKKKCKYRDEVISYNDSVDDYNRKRRKYWSNECDKKYCQIVDDFKRNKYPFIVSERDKALNQLLTVRSTLEMLYNLRINGVLCLHPNYRGLIPISIIYGYFDTGRCTQLQGHEGAYNLYEDEKMKGMIINKLDVVSHQLGQLQDAMVYVGKAIEECNSRLSNLESASNRMISSVNNMSSNISKQISGVSNQMSAIEENTANSAYYAEVGARMTTFNTVYNLLND